VTLRITCDYQHRKGRVEVLQADRPIVVRGVPVRGAMELEDGDTIRIDAGQVLRCDFTERIIEEERNIIRSLEVRDLTCRFRDGGTAIDNLTFSIERGEMVCVMGASGCGKSTLLRALAGQFGPVAGEVLLNQRSLYGNLDALLRYITYIPQYDAFDEQLTIEENLRFAAAIRAPHLSRRERQRRIDSKLAELGLNERRREVVGGSHRKVLSGGERKRLNIGLDMVSTADIYLFDEPTSGLSSKDSEHVIEIIRGMAHNKIVLVTIHQPTSKIFQMFQKAVLLDKGASSSSLVRPPRCWPTSPRRSASSSLAPSWAAARPAARRGRNSSSTSWKRPCAISAATSSTRRTTAASWCPLDVSRPNTGAISSRRGAS